MEIILKKIIKTALYLMLIILFSSSYNLRASDQDLSNQPSKYSPSFVKEEHAETFSHKRKREDKKDLESEEKHD